MVWSDTPKRPFGFGGASLSTASERSAGSHSDVSPIWAERKITLQLPIIERAIRFAGLRREITSRGRSLPSSQFLRLRSSKFWIPPCCPNLPKSLEFDLFDDRQLRGRGRAGEKDPQDGWDSEPAR